MQHSSAVLDLVPMTPEMWLELEPILTPMPCATCRSSPIPSGNARCCLATAMALRSTLGNCVSLSFCGLGATVGWVGHQIFSDSGSSKGAASAASGAQGTTLEPLSVVPHAHGVVENLFSTASSPVSTVLLDQLV